MSLPTLTLVPSPDRHVNVISTMRREFTMWPRLRLTLAQACRLWSLETTTCRELLSRLVDEGAVAQRPDGAYVSTPSALDAARAS